MELKKELNAMANLKLDLGDDLIHTENVETTLSELNDCWERRCF